MTDERVLESSVVRLPLCVFLPVIRDPLSVTRYP